MEPKNFTIMLLVLVLVHFARRAASSMESQHPICSTEQTQVMCTEVGRNKKNVQGRVQDR
jgi:hypothetical protein